MKAYLPNRNSASPKSVNSYTALENKDSPLKPSDIIFDTSLFTKYKHLSHEAYTLLCAALSHSGYWSFEKEEIIPFFREGLPAVEKGLKELRSLGHLYHMIKVSNVDDRPDETWWFWFEKPPTEKEIKSFFEWVT